MYYLNVLVIKEQIWSSMGSLIFLLKLMKVMNSSNLSIVSWKIWWMYAVSPRIKLRKEARKAMASLIMSFKKKCPKHCEVDELIKEQSNIY
jgi:hypothetical protein